MKYKKNIMTKIFFLLHTGGASRAINAYFNGISDDGIVVSSNIKNCEIREYEFRNKN